MSCGTRQQQIGPQAGSWLSVGIRILAVASALAPAPALAVTHYYTLAGNTAGVENGCPGWVLADHDDDCSWNNGHPLGAGNAQWIGPVFSAGYYPPGAAPQLFTTPPAPAPVTAPSAVLPIGGTTGIPITSAFLALDDQDTAAGSDDYISGTIELGGFDRNVASSAGTRLVETFGRIIHRLARVRVSSATPNAAGGYDYVVAMSGGTAAYPTLLQGSTTAGGGFSDFFPSQVASQSSPDVSDQPYWSAPGAHGIAALDGSGFVAGTSSAATVWDYACNDGNAVPAAHDCDNSYMTWSGDGVASLTNVLLRISTSSGGLITTAQAVLVQEAETAASLNGTDTWIATTLDFTGSSTDLPVAFDDRSILIMPLGAVSVDVLANDLPGVAPVTVTIESGPAQGTASVVSNRIRYQRDDTPESVQEITYRVTDSSGHSATATAQVIITDPVACADDEVTGAPDTPVTVDVLANDSGFDIPPVVLTIATQPADGSSVVDPDRRITFTPPAGKGGSYVTEYFLADGTNRPVTCRLTVKLPATPVAVDDSAAVLQGANVLVDVLANDLEVSDTPLTLAIAQAAAHGTATPESSPSGPRIRYTPASGFAGPDSFQYTITDADGDTSGSATVTISVVGPPGNDLPSCANDEVDGLRNAPTIVNVLANDTGLNAPPVTVEVLEVSPADAATATVNPDNSITVTPGTDKGGTIIVAYLAREAVNDPVLCYAVVKVDDAPVANDDNFDGLNFGRSHSLAVLNNDLGLSDVPLTLEITVPPAHGTALLCAAASPDCPGFSATTRPYVVYRYNDNAGFPASDQFRYRVTDADGDASNEATARITVRNVVDAANDPNNFDPALAGTYFPPVFQSVGYATSSGHSVTLNVLRNDGGFLNGPVTLAITTAPAKGTVVVNADQSVTYTAPPDFTGLAQFSYTITDSQGQADTADVGVYVFPGPKTDSGSSALDLPVLLLLLGGLLGRRWRRTKPL